MHAVIVKAALRKRLIMKCALAGFATIIIMGGCHSTSYGVKEAKHDIDTVFASPDNFQGNTREGREAFNRYANYVFGRSVNPKSNKIVDQEVADYYEKMKLIYIGRPHEIK